MSDEEVYAIETWERARSASKEAQVVVNEAYVAYLKAARRQEGDNS